jgi:hypothetical protein
MRIEHPINDVATLPTGLRVVVCMAGGSLNQLVPLMIGGDCMNMQMK